MTLPPIVDARDLRKTYRLGRSEIHALRGVSLAVQPGEFLLVMGPSGSGKSTLLQLLGCLDTPTAGHVSFDGEPVEGLGLRRLAHIRSRRVGFVFQSFHLMPGYTAAQNVELPLTYAGASRKERRERVARALESVGLAGRARHLPVELSAGERQRVAIARAMVNHPALVCADEPTGNLDSATGAEVMGLLRRIPGDGRAVVMVTHNPEHRRFATRVLHLRDGLLETLTGSEK